MSKRSPFLAGAFGGRGAFLRGSLPFPSEVEIPVNVTAPVISGADLLISATLSCTNGVWTDFPSSYAFQWYVDGVAVGGETSSTYVIQTADAGLAITCEVVATNSAGSSSAQVSNTLTAANLSAPSNTVAPFLDETAATTGDTITCSPGTWAGNPPPSYSYEWFGNTTSLTNTYLNDGNEETGVYCEVTATNSQGSGGPEASDTCDFTDPPPGPGMRLVSASGDALVTAGGDHLTTAP